MALPKGVRIPQKIGPGDIEAEKEVAEKVAKKAEKK
jgi:hypothetical protein